MTNWPLWSARIENTALALDAAARMYPGGGAAATADDNEGPKVDGEAGSSTPTWEQMRGPVMRGVARVIDSIDSRDAAASMASVYFPAYLQGRTLTRREIVQSVDEYEMPFGAPPLRYATTLRLDSIDRRANTATVTRRSSLDQASGRAAISAMTEFLSEALIEPLSREMPGGQPPPDRSALAEMVNSMLTEFSYEDTTRGVIDMTTGFARETVTDYTMSARVAASDQPMVTRGRVVTRVSAGAPQTPRLPRE